jgi:Putative abortive phage resistance protein AbiGi, antitoxin
MRIRDLISRRTDLSTFLVHLTREEGAESGRARLEGIIRTGRIEARSPYGQARTRVDGDAAAEASQRVACFTETPLEHVHLLTEDIDARQVRFAPYGIALTKQIARTRGVNPVWYVDITPGHNWLTNPLNALIDQGIAAGNFAGSDIAKITPFIEQMGTQPPNYRKEFWWEREWRHSGDFELPQRFIGVCPTAEHAQMVALVEGTERQAVWIDATWGLEEIIGRLAGFAAEEVSVID